MSDAAAQQELLEEARQAGEFIRSSIVQAACTDRGTYGAHAARGLAGLSVATCAGQLLL